MRFKKRIVFVRKQSTDLNQMALFAEVVEVGSFTGAARSLDVSKGYVSKQISQLEEQLGVVLLRRTTRNLRLTEEGERFLEYCLEVVDTAEEGWRVLQNRGRQMAGPLRISAPITYGQLFLPELIQAFCHRYPGVTVDLVLDNRAVDLLGENFDLTFRITENPPTNYALTALGVMEDVVCAAPSLLQTFDPPGSPQQLSSLPCLLYLNPNRLAVWSFKKRRKVELVEVTGQMAFSQHSALLGPLLRGQGVAKLPEYFVREYLDDGRLVRLLESFECGTIPIYLVHRKLSEQPPRVREFVRFAQQYIQPG